MSRRHQGKNKPFLFLQMVRVKKLPEGYEKGYPFKEGDWVYYLGEIPTAPGHCAVAVPTDRKRDCDLFYISMAYHIDQFERIPDELPTRGRNLNLPRGRA